MKIHPKPMPRETAAYHKTLERETGIEPATNSLEGCDSTTELLPPCSHPNFKYKILRFAQDFACGLPLSLTPATLLKLLPPISKPTGYPVCRRHLPRCSAAT